LKTDSTCSKEFFRILIIEGSLEVKLPTIRTDGKAEVGRVREEKESAGHFPKPTTRFFVANRL
jgi:hypothetical protein